MIKQIKISILTDVSNQIWIKDENHLQIRIAKDRFYNQNIIVRLKNHVKNLFIDGNWYLKPSREQYLLFLIIK